jgi:hypothetical protein
MKRRRATVEGRKTMTERDPLSMQTDNTEFGRTYGDTIEGGPISQVQIGDRVVDSTGKEFGKVKFVKMGDPTATTTEGQEGYETSFLGWTFEGGLEKLPEQDQARLVRVGYIHIDIPLAPDKYAGGFMLDRVEDGAVYLAVTEDNLY